MNDVGLRRFLDWCDGVRSVEGIVGVDIVIAENGDVGVVAESEADGFQFELFSVCQTEIGDCKKKRIIFDRGADGQFGEFLFPLVVRILVGDRLLFESSLDGSRALMLLVHVIDMIRWRNDKVFLIGEEQAVEIVDKLSGIGHLHLVAVIIENVEGEGGDESITHCALLLEEIVAFRGTGAAWMPAAPFIDNERALILAVEAADKIPCLVDDMIHEGCFGEQVVELFVCEVETAAA